MTAGRRVAVLGAGGFVGGELLRLVALHPRLELEIAASASLAGRPVGEVLPGLAPFTEAVFSDPAELDPAQLADGPWALLTALPHGEAMVRLAALLAALGDADLQVVDLGADFRLADGATWEATYGSPHAAPALLAEFVYGLPELNRTKIAAARRVANPGCFATAAALALLPFAAGPWTVQSAAVTAMTGSSGAGIAARHTTHHPLRASNLQAYSPLAHRHQPEIAQSWRAAGGDPTVPLGFVPHMAPLVRGIALCAQLTVAETVSGEAAAGRLADFYADAPFVRVLRQPPGVREVWGSNRCELAATAAGRLIAVTAVLDNLVKGAAGQALQNLNLMNRWPETEGLLLPPPTPV